LPGISKWGEFAAKNRICPRYQRNFVEMAENACMIEEVIHDRVKKEAGNSGFVRLSPHLALMLAARYGKLINNTLTCRYHRQKVTI
jgi:hypothetical protein